MTKSIIVGTAGHIDHGKTALVRALTGIDADRLPEEKRRGITIDVGFADLDLGEVRIGFVDVPGHERFVKNMLAGAHGIDAVLLVIAADESVMPQTREHFDICRLLGVRQGLIGITKKDLVDDELLPLVRNEIEELVAGSFLAGAPVIAVSSRTNEGLEDLKQELLRLGGQIPARPSEFVTRLPIDRAFTMRGFGAVVTGTLIAGEISEGDELQLLPKDTRVRARGLQVHGSSVKQALAGQRTAINLGGIDAAAIERGMVLVSGGHLRPTQALDARVELLEDNKRSLRSRQRIRVHLGATETLARVRVLEEINEIKPGESGLVQLRFETPVVAALGDRFILRSYSPQHTIGGGLVLNPLAAKHRKRDLSEVVTRLQRLLTGNRAEQLSEFVAANNKQGLRRPELTAYTAWRDEVIEAAVDQAINNRAIVDGEGVLISRTTFAELMLNVTNAVSKHHQIEPLSRGLPKEVLRERLFAHSPPELMRAVLVQLEKTNALTIEKEVLRSRGHTLTLSDSDSETRQRLEAAFKKGALSPPNLNEAFEFAGLPAGSQHSRKILQLLIDAGVLVRVQGDMFFHRQALDELTRKLRENQSKTIDVAQFKTLAGISRKYAIPLLEYFDRQRVTRREGDRRLIL